MSLCKRLVARLDIKGNRLIKGIRFEGLRVIGDPLQYARSYSSQGIDEILFIDSVASLYGRNSLTDILRSTSRDVFVPITAGGGVRTVQDASDLLAAGADKIAVNTAALENPELLKQLVLAFGSQCVVASIQARNTGPSSWEAMSECGRERSGRNIHTWIQDVQNLGVGEILLTSVDNDGTCHGADFNLLDSVRDIISVPLIYSGGISNPIEVENILDKKSVSGVSIGAAFHKNLLKPADLKDHLLKSDCSDFVRACTQTLRTDTSQLPLKGKRLGIIDYAMGNQQSLVNALEYLGSDVVLTDEPDLLSGCDLLFLPGVGSFPRGMSQLIDKGLDTLLIKLVSSGMPLIGICLGMQMLFNSSDEFQFSSGLGFVDGHVAAIPDINAIGDSVMLPHMGWNLISQNSNNSSFPPVFTSNEYQYFVHSYVATDVSESSILFTTSYQDLTLVAAVSKGHLLGFQFHPERSGASGLQLLSSSVKHLLSS